MKILLAICGSISAYKTIDLTRELTKLGHEVKIIFTSGALKFVKPELFSYLGASATYLPEEDFLHSNVLHVDLGKWADVFVIAPLSANSLSRLARGEASDLLTSVFLAMPKEKPILVFPSMNTNMLTHPFTEENFKDLSKLKSLNQVFISDTKEGLLACGDIGSGKLPNIEDIIDLIETVNPLKNQSKHVLISTGASIIPIDPVRYLTNSSSGETGFRLAKEFLKLGFKVTVASGMQATSKLDHLLKHPNFTLARLKTVSDFNDFLTTEFQKTNLYIASAALSDWEVEVQDKKIKKDSGLNELKLKPAPDVLKNLLALKKNQHIVGFAAETELTNEMLATKMQKKPVDLLIGTKVNNGLTKSQTQVEGFNNTNATYKIVDTKLNSLFEGDLQKSELAKKIIEWLKI